MHNDTSADENIMHSTEIIEQCYIGQEQQKDSLVENAIRELYQVELREKNI